MAFSVLRSARLISALTLGSRILGLIRDMACSYAFGARAEWSAFSVAFLVPNLFRRLFGEGALSAASIPALTRTLARDGQAAADAVAGKLVAILIAVLAAVCVLAECVIAGLYVWYQDDGDKALAVSLAAITMPYMVFICTTAMLGGVQNVFGRFGVPAAMPIVLNVFMIAGALTAHAWVPKDHRTGVVLLAATVVAAGVAQLAWQWAAVRRSGLRLPLRLDVRDKTIRQIALTMLPMVAGLAAVQVNALMDTLIAWWFVQERIVPGESPESVGPAILYYAQRLYQFPLGVFSIALATAIFPVLSRHASDDDMPGLGRTLSRGLRLATFEGLPCLVGLILVREPLVHVLFHRGAFAEWPEAADRVAFALAMYAIGIWAYALNQIVVRAFYALHDARTPMRVAVVNVVLNLGLNLWLVQTALKESGLALATSICACLQFAVLVRRLSRRIGHVDWADIGQGAARTLIATAAMAAAVYAADRFALAERASLIRLAGLVTTGAVTYLAAAWALRCGELRDVLRR